MAPSKNHSQAGFTLIETTIAMVLMAIVGLGVASVFTFAAANTSSAADREMATAVAQQQMEQLRLAAFNDAALNATATAGVVTNVTRRGRQYEVTTTIADSLVIDSLPTQKTITVKVVPLNENAKWARDVNTIFGSVTLVTVRTALQIGPNRSL